MSSRASFMTCSGRGGTGSRIHSRAGSPMKIRGAEGTREACSAACLCPSECVAVLSAESLHDQPGEVSRLVDPKAGVPQLAGAGIEFAAVGISHHNFELSRAATKPVEVEVRRLVFQPLYERGSAIRLAECQKC